MNDNKYIIPIEVTALAIEHEGSTFYYIRHVFNALCEHKELLEDEEYLRLYYEARDYLYRRDLKNGHWQNKSAEEAYKCIEFLAYLSNKHPEFVEKISLENVNFLLEKRRKVWYE